MVFSLLFSLILNSFKQENHHLVHNILRFLTKVYFTKKIAGYYNEEDMMFIRE